MDLALAVLRAYNDSQVDEWAGAYRGRIIRMMLPVLWDAGLCAEEVRRVARKGCHSVTFTENPATLGYPSFHSDYSPRRERLLRCPQTLGPCRRARQRSRLSSGLSTGRIGRCWRISASSPDTTGPRLTGMFPTPMAPSTTAGLTCSSPEPTRSGEHGSAPQQVLSAGSSLLQPPAMA